jgi:FkbM family methyltransferase
MRFEASSVVTGPFAVFVRGLARRLGLNKIIGGLIGRAGYEAAYFRALSQAVLPGDCVWDVGANRGYYTSKFVELVGDEGRVLAFEPSANNMVHLREAAGGRTNVFLYLIGLSNAAREAGIIEGKDALGATTRIATDQHGSAMVRLESGDSLVESGQATRPNILKIDVEGHESEVLDGLRNTLRDPAVRAVFVEIHFAILAAQGHPNAPREIAQLLRGSGFEVRWTDPSHLQAIRPEHAPDGGPSRSSGSALS